MLSQMQAKIRQLSPVGSPKNQKLLNKLKDMAEGIEYASSDGEASEAGFREHYQQHRAPSPEGFYHQLAMTQQAQRQSQPRLALETILGPGMIPPRRPPPRRPPAKSPQTRPQTAAVDQEETAVAALPASRQGMLPLTSPAADISIEDKHEMERDLFVRKLLNGELDPNLDP